MHKLTLFAVMILLIAACQPAATETPGELPTLAQIPSQTPTETLTPTITNTPAPTDPPTETPTETLTETPAPTITPFPTDTPSPTADVTRFAVASATQRQREAPRFYTLTPARGGVIAPTTTPEVLADVTITEAQFQEEVDIAFADSTTITFASINFVTGGISTQLEASGGDASITGTVFISIQTDNGLAQIQVTDVQTNFPEPPEAYLDVVRDEFFPSMINVLTAILTQRVGAINNLETLTVTEDAMLITLLVPITRQP